jgi:hypothetical protein
MTDPEDDTVRLDLSALVDPDPTAYVERYRPPVPPVRRRAGVCYYCLAYDGDPHRADCDRPRPTPL